MAKHRTHSIEFKRQVAQEFLAGETLHGLAKRHDICRNLSGSGFRSTRPAPLTKTRPRRIFFSNMKPGSRRWNGLSASKRWSSSL